jgi:AcrR family transcriptional regulator
MGLSQSSIYQAFGSKDHLFSLAVDRYEKYWGDFISQALTQEGTAQQAVVALLSSAARVFTDPSKPTGCMVILSALNCAEANRKVGQDLARRRTALTSAISGRLARGVSEGDLPCDIDVPATALLITATLQGMAILARDGADRLSLEACAKALKLSLGH